MIDQGADLAVVFQNSLDGLFHKTRFQLDEVDDLLQLRLASFSGEEQHALHPPVLHGTGVSQERIPEGSIEELTEHAGRQNFAHTVGDMMIELTTWFQ